ncbi:hypothetical protein HB991_13570 [Yersinia mollaretii]|uniref:Phage protein n=1 Tax=Yersinia mollaretii TaxID=33060 RepID=A0AA44I0C6_YERMO|nr:hypothetical protein [Yersinia mollaretii]NIL23533.1 hypothetical protein [Yersinia mollaretii]
MSISLIQPSFSGGEISPSLHGRVDLSRYQNSLRKCRNFIVRQSGGVENRPGTQFIGNAKYNDKKCRLIPFQFSTIQTYALEFGHGYMRVFKDGAQVLFSYGPTVGQVFELEMPYQEADLFDLKFTQSADVMTIVHPNYEPRELQRYAHDDWRLASVVTTNGPFEDINVDKAIKVYSSGTTGTVTLTASANIFGAEQVGKLFYLEQLAIDSVPIWEVAKTTAVNDVRRAGSYYYRANTAGTTGTLRPSHDEGMSWDGWGGATGIQWEYLHSGFGIVRITSVAAGGLTAVGAVVSYIPSNAVGAGNASYKWAHYAWNSVSGYPGTVVYYQQRLFFAASTKYPQTIWGSRVGDYKDFGKNNPLQDDDRIIYTYAGRQVNQIRHLIDVGSLIALTSGGEYQITGDQNKTLTPSSFTFSSQGSNGSSNLPPIAVSNIALFIQEKGSIIRDLAYSFDVDGYSGSDLTILANHLFNGYKIVDWSFSIVPYSVAWCIRNDGKLLCLTYLREQQIFGWAPQESPGDAFESTCSISEGAEDAAYFVLRRVVNGQSVRYIERLSSRIIENINNAFFVDSGLTYDGRNTDTGRLIILSGGSGDWEYTTELTLSINGSSYFTSSYIGAVIQLPYTENDESKTLRLTILSITNGNSVTVQASRNVTETLRNTPTSAWSVARVKFGGLEHLEGRTVSILSDGNVEPIAVVTDGSVSIGNAGSVVHIGLPITSEFETLDVNIAGQETLLDKNKLITSASLLVETSRGIFAGTDKDRLYEYPQREFEFYDNSVASKTGMIEVKLDSNWGKNGRVYVRQSDPLPLSVLAIIPKVTVGG